MKNSISARQMTKEGFPGFFLALLMLAAIIALLTLGLVGARQPYILVAVVAVVFMALLLFFRQDELAATIILAVSLYIDWYLSVRVVALIMTLLLLCFFFLARSPQRPWAEPRALWLWAIFLGLAIFPAIRGALTLHDALLYYPDIVLGAFIIYWLGLVIGRDAKSFRRFFQILAGFGVVIAIHTIIQATLHVTLLESSAASSYLASVSNYELAAGTGISRLGSFFIDPNWNGTFLAIMVFIPFGLFAESSYFLHKILYFVEMLLILSALLFTYSSGAWYAVMGGLIVFLVFVGHNRYRVQIPLFIFIATIIVLTLFPSQINLLLQHSSDPGELALRNAVWQTALRVIQAYPLTGIGLGHLAYLQRAEPYRSTAQILPYDHPHNSYLEWGAMAGLPVLLMFLALIAFALWCTFYNWRQADTNTRMLLGAGIAAISALSINSWSINGWTLPPIAAVGWMILGVISSPLLSKREKREETPETSKVLTSYSGEN